MGARMGCPTRGRMNARSMTIPRSRARGAGDQESEPYGELPDDEAEPHDVGTDDQDGGLGKGKDPG